MASESKRSNSFRFNFDLVMTEIARWPLATLLVLVAATVVTVLVPDPNTEKLSAFDKALILGGTLSATLGLKVLLLLMVHPLIRSAPFPGSYLLTSFITFVPIFPFYVAWSRVADVVFDEKPTPVSVLIPGLLFAYVLFSVVFAGFLRIMHAILANPRNRWDVLIRKKLRSLVGDDEPPDPANSR